MLYMYIIFQATLTKAFYIGGNWGREKQSNILKVTQVGMGKVGIWM